MTRAENLHQIFDDLITYIKDAERQIDNGKILQMSTLEQTVAGLCEMVKKSDSKAAKDLQPKMGELISALDSLAARLKDFKENAQKD